LGAEVVDCLGLVDAEWKGDWGRVGAVGFGLKCIEALLTVCNVDVVVERG
jgi:hypothetical protein